MTDLDILIELSDYYEVGLQEIVLAYIIMKDASLYNNPTVVIRVGYCTGICSRNAFSGFVIFQPLWRKD